MNGLNAIGKTTEKNAQSLRLLSPADEDDGVELPAKIVNEDLRRFFMPKKYAEPEPVQKIAPEVRHPPHDVPHALFELASFSAK